MVQSEVSTEFLSYLLAMSPPKKNTPPSHFLSSLDWMIASCHPLGFYRRNIKWLTGVFVSDWLIQFTQSVKFLQWCGIKFCLYLSFLLHSQTSAPSLVPVPAGQGLLWKWEEGVSGLSPGFTGLRVVFPTWIWMWILARMSSTCGPSIHYPLPSFWEAEK